MTAYDSLTPYEKTVLALLWRIVQNTCPLLPDTTRVTGPRPEKLFDEFAAAQAGRKRTTKGGRP